MMIGNLANDNMRNLLLSGNCDEGLLTGIVGKNGKKR
jgi:hypothetical protein